MRGFPRFPAMPRLYLPFWAWIFVASFMAMFYMCVVVVWGLFFGLYWIIKGVALGVQRIKARGSARS